MGKIFTKRLNFAQSGHADWQAGFSSCNKYLNADVLAVEDAVESNLLDAGETDAADLAVDAMARSS
jgi:hypothetical protein